MLRTRLSSSAGQVAAEYVGGLLIVAVVIGALLSGQVHTKIAVETERAICKITGSAHCGQPGVPQAPDAGDDPPGKPDREVHDAECEVRLDQLLRGARHSDAQRLLGRQADEVRRRLRLEP
jgi:hypothetical protein